MLRVVTMMEIEVELTVMSLLETFWKFLTARLGEKVSARASLHVGLGTVMRAAPVAMEQEGKARDKCTPRDIIL
jgi:hypothetical protein